MNNKLNDALNEISDKHLNQAETYKKRRMPYWVAAVAALLVFAIGIGTILGGNGTPGITTGPALLGSSPTTATPGFTSTPTTNPNVTHPPLQTGPIDLSAVLELSDLAAAPSFPALLAKPDYENYNSYEEYLAARDAYRADQAAQYDQPEGYADSLVAFFSRSIRQFLSGDENKAYSPVNVYLALAMLAETADGNSRQQILNLFGVDSIEQLRLQASYLWNAHYNNDGETTLLLANSLWLDDAYSFHSNTVDRLATDYYASVFHSDLGTDESDEQLRAWINAMTGGLLTEQSKNIRLDELTVFALASTVYFKADWTDKFFATKEATFHAPSGDKNAQFMRKVLYTENEYYRGSNFGAVCLGLTGDNRMWLVLPDEGVALSEVLASDEYLQLTLDPDSWENCAEYEIHLSLPKFDIASQTDLCEGMKKLGVTDIFDWSIADFTPITDTPELYVKKIDHAVRVTIDENGVAAAAYTVIEVPGGGMPPELEELDFTLDRPFLFIVSSQDNLPLFSGIVNEP